MANNRLQSTKTQALYIRVTPEEISRWRDAALVVQAESLSSWVRRALNAAAAKVLR